MRQLESRLARLEVRTPRTAWGSLQPPDHTVTTPERTATVAQILVDAGALRITADGELLTRISGSWRPYTPQGGR